MNYWTKICLSGCIIEYGDVAYSNPKFQTHVWAMAVAPRRSRSLKIGHQTRIFVLLNLSREGLYITFLEIHAWWHPTCFIVSINSSELVSLLEVVTVTKSGPSGWIFKFMASDNRICWILMRQTTSSCLTMFRLQYHGRESIQDVELEFRQQETVTWQVDRGS